MTTLIKFGYAFLVMLFPTILFGATFPLVTTICVQDPKSMGREIGMVNAVNTIGATLGALLAGFLFIAAFGIQKSIMFTAWLNICIGFVLLAFIHFKNKKTKVVYLTCSLVLFLLITSMIPAWDKLRMSTSFLEPNQEIEKALTMEYYHEDAFGITSVVEFTPWTQKYLISNRIYTQNTSDLMGLEDHRRLGHIPLLLHKDPEKALVIGLGAGITLRGVSEHQLKNVDVVEIAEGVKNAAKYFSKENNHVLENPHNNFIIEDGRNYVATSKKKYDVIIADIYFPMSSGSSNMFSQEYFELLKARLNEGGLMAQWLPLHQLSMDEVKIIVNTFTSVFPNTSLWYGMTGESVPVAGLIGMDERLTIHVDSLMQKYQSPVLKKELREVALDDPFLLLNNFIMEGNSINQFVGNVPINTDNNPILEFMSPKLHGEHGEQNQLIFDSLKEDPTAYIEK
ncbi:fused MFS/spermidine synthase [Neobacillus niacini]|uniref:spermidine synthase n=1 Tax=Neobacillus niacini TaxID=86668 RepID=UPI0030012F6E